MKQEKDRAPKGKRDRRQKEGRGSAEDNPATATKSTFHETLKTNYPFTQRVTGQHSQQLDLQ